MTETRILFEDAVAGLERAIALKGEDYVYRPDELPDGSAEGCKYIQDNAEGQPAGCIVGHYLLELGVTKEWLLGDRRRNEDNIYGLSGRLDIKFASDALVLLWRVQEKQDSGTPWGEALRKAKATFGVS